jgi:hypothetical protein
VVAAPALFSLPSLRRVLQWAGAGVRQAGFPLQRRPLQRHHHSGHFSAAPCRSDGCSPRQAAHLYRQPPGCLLAGRPLQRLCPRGPFAGRALCCPAGEKRAGLLRGSPGSGAGLRLEPCRHYPKPRFGSPVFPCSGRLADLYRPDRIPSLRRSAARLAGHPSQPGTGGAAENRIPRAQRALPKPCPGFPSPLVWPSNRWRARGPAAGRIGSVSAEIGHRCPSARERTPENAAPAGRATSQRVLGPRRVRRAADGHLVCPPKLRRKGHNNFQPGPPQRYWALSHQVSRADQRSLRRASGIPAFSPS